MSGKSITENRYRLKDQTLTKQNRGDKIYTEINICRNSSPRCEQLNAEAKPLQQG